MFLNYLNTKHRNIEFTVKHEFDDSLPFLVVKVIKLYNKHVTYVFRKVIFTGLGSNSFSFVPQLLKVNYINSFVYRAYIIRNSWKNFDLKTYSNYLTISSYPSFLLEKL